VAWTFWDGTGAAELAEILGRSAADPMDALCLLVTSARLPNLEHEEARELMEASHHLCPYSNAIRGNVDVQLVVVEPAVIS
jgi:organic hydroperoxide reductase OsmC/OhrA